MMLQKQKERLSKEAPQEYYAYRYGSRLIYVQLLLFSICLLGIIPFIVITIYNFFAHGKYDSSIFMLSSVFLVWPLLVAAIESAKQYQIFKKDILIADDNCIEWQRGDSKITIKWEEVLSITFQNDIYHIAKAGTDESIVPIWNPLYIREVSPQYLLSYSHSSKCNILEIIKGKCPSIAWENIQMDTETLHIPSTYSAYQISGAQVFSYHTKNNQGAVWAWLFIFGPILVTAHIARRLNENIPFQVGIACLIMFPFLFLYMSYRWQWYKQSQVEIDDLAITLIEPKGVTWSVPWFVIAKYHTNDSHGILTAKDGKTYQFRRTTAQKEELDSEIMRRVAQNRQTSWGEDA
jgi:hypothetical protein